MIDVTAVQKRLDLVLALVRELSLMSTSKFGELSSSSAAPSTTFDHLAEELLALRGKHSDSSELELLEIAPIAVSGLLEYPDSELVAAYSAWVSRHGPREVEVDSGALDPNTGTEIRVPYLAWKRYPGWE